MTKRNLALVGVLLAVGLAGLVLMSRRGGVAPAPADGQRRAGPAEDARVQPPSSSRRTASQPPNARAAADARVLLSATWGQGPHQLGRDRPQQGNPEAPMSLAVDPQGGAVVLDQINGRLSRFGRDGAPLGTVPLTVQAAQDLAIAPDGTTAVMDRLVDKTIALLGADGTLIGELPLEGKGLEEGGAATGVFIDGEDVYVEREHGKLVRVGDTKGKADTERPSLPGRPSRDGRSYLTAAIIDAPSGRLYVNAIARDTGQHRFTRELKLAGPVQSIALLDTDRAGIIYLGAIAELPGATALLLTCLDPLDGHPLGSARLPVNASADETFRELTVFDTGGVLYAFRTEERVELQRHDCR